MFKKILKKDKNEELEKILEEKNVDEQARNLLQGILYKIEVSYKDYQKSKGIETTEEQYVKQLLVDIKQKCNKIKIVKISEKLNNEEIENELKKNKFYISKDEIISYPIERKILYAIEKNANNKKILDDQYGDSAIAVSDFINTGKNIDRVEVLRDFNGWSWTTVKEEIENIDANLIYQMLQILFGRDFLDNWTKDKDGKIDYFKIMENDDKRYSKIAIDNLKKLLIKIAMINDVKENQEFEEYISKKLRAIKKELKMYEDTKTNIERISEHKTQAMKQLKDIERILRQEPMLLAEYEKRKGKVDIKELKKELSDQRRKLLNEISEDNYLLNPMNYIKEKKKLEEEKAKLDIKRTTKKQKENVKVEFIKIFLQCFNIRIKISIEEEEVRKLIYQFRYFMCLPFDEANNVKNFEQIEEDVKETEQLLIKKAMEFKVINRVPFEVMKHVFETRIITLEELYYKITKESEIYYVQIFDDNITEEKFEIKPIEKIKLNKKLKIFI